MLAVLQFDAAAQPLVERLLGEERLPVLAELRRRGGWSALDTGATVLQSATYPTLCSGMDVRQHGIYSALLWSPREQRSRFAHEFPTPPAIWDRLSRCGRRSLIVDPYLAWHPSQMQGVYLSGWQFRDRMVLPGLSIPGRLGPMLAARHGRPPALHDVYGHHDAASLLRVSEALRAAPSRTAAAVRHLLRRETFDFVWVNFCAAHKAGHHLWEPRALLDGARDRRGARRLEGALERVYEAVDRALGVILDALPPACDLIVLSPTGMGPNTSRADLLPGMLDAVLAARPGTGARKPSPLRSRVWSLRSAVPVRWRAQVARALPDRFVADLMTRLYASGRDSRAPALAVPGENKGYIRLNLRGRERDGRVERSDAAAVADEIAAGLSTFTDPDGFPAISRVTRISDITGEIPDTLALPDLVVSWGERSAARLRGVTSPRFGDIPRQGVGSGRTGNHTDEAWAILVPGASRIRTIGRAPRIVDIGATACALLGADTSQLAGTPLFE